MCGLLRYTAGLFAFMLISACAGNKAQRQLKKDDAVFHLRMEKGPCFGSCPVYNLDVKSDGTAVLEAIRFMPKEGMLLAQLPPVEIDSLKELLVTREFFALDSIYDNPSLSDLPATKVSLEVGREKELNKTVIGRYDTPEDFDAVVAFLERLRKRHF